MIRPLCVACVVVGALAQEGESSWRHYEGVVIEDTHGRALGGEDALILGKDSTVVEVWSLTWVESVQGFARYLLVDASTSLCLGAAQVGGALALDMVNCSRGARGSPRWEFREREDPQELMDVPGYRIVSYGSDDQNGDGLMISVDNSVAVLTLDEEAETWMLPRLRKI